MNIKIFPYRYILGKNDEQNKLFKDNIQRIINSELIDFDLNNIEIYNINLIKKYEVNKNNTCFILGNTATKNTGILETNSPINGIENDFNKFYNPSGEESLLIKSPEGIALAEWFGEYNSLYILFNIFEEFNNESVLILNYIMEKFNTLVWKEKSKDKSWLRTNNKNKFISQIREIYIKQKESFILNEKNRLKDIEYNITSTQQELKNKYDTANHIRRIITNEEKNLHIGFNTLIKDLDLIIKNENISDLIFKNNVFHIYTKHLNIFDENNNEYIGDKFNFTIDLNNSSVRIFSKNPQKGFWSSHDPHPHVDGNTNIPCLGNISDTIAELCSQMQLYAIVTVILDFLQSANTKDVAGEYVKYRDMIDENGKIIPSTYNKTIICHECGCDINDEDEIYEVFYGLVNNEPEINAIVCENCFENYFTYDDNHEAYLHNDVCSNIS